MAHRIDIIPHASDARATAKKKAWAASRFGKKITAVSIVDSYVIDTRLSREDLARVKSALINPRLERVLSPRDTFSLAIEIGYLPGVTDNIGTTTRETIEDLLKRKFKPGEAVYTSRVYLLKGALKKDNVEKIASSLYNPLIERATIYTKKDLGKKSFPAYIPKVHLTSSKDLVTKVPVRFMDEGELKRTGKEGIAGRDGIRRGPLALDTFSMDAIQKYFLEEKRDPTDIELESIAQTWSEHCKHTIFASPINEIERGLYRSYIKRATQEIRKKKGKNDFCVSVFTDNAGGIVFDKEWVVTHKVETHNSPSALDPFGGAITGIVGVNRDAMGFGLGAKPVANMYGFCFAYPNDTRSLYKDKARTHKMLSPRRIIDGVVAGINAGGNCSGIPTMHGFLYFHDNYRGKPLVFAGTVGLIPRKVKGKNSWEKKARPRDYIVMVGGRVGLDGIHGATFSSETMDSGSPATAVQIGDPITQKKMSDALIKEARDQDLYTSITDDGAGGLSCSVAEMAKECGGAKVYLDKVPLKYPGLLPWQIWISESQERMTLAVPKGKWKRLKALLDSRGVEATVIGEFTKAPRCQVFWKNKKIMDLAMHFLHDGVPLRHLTTEKPKRIFYDPETPRSSLKDLALRLLARPSIASHAFVARQYDHEVQAGSITKPLFGRGGVDADTEVFRPVLSSWKGVALSSALYPTYSEIDPYAMAASAIDTSVRNLIATGARLQDIAILDNTCWSSSDTLERLWELKEAIRSCYDTAVAFETPFISGKDSMFNDFRGYDEKGNSLHIAVPPTLLISSIAVIPDARKVVTPDFKMKGDVLYVLGETKKELGGSQFFHMLSDTLGDEKACGTSTPQVDLTKNKKMYKMYERAVGKGLIASATSISHGGLFVALMKSALGGELGATLATEKIGKNLSSAEMLFSESQGRLLVSVDPKNARAFEKMMGALCTKVGIVGGTSVRISHKGKTSLSMKLAEAKASYQKTFKNF